MSSRGHSQDRALSPDRETPFSGYGDRVGSGVAYAPKQWKGGELVSDPSLVTKSLKTRRFYYSPIGDGVVAADGVELKRLPPDLSPKVEIIQQRIVEKTPGGKAGLKVTEKTWTTGGTDSDASLAYGQQQMGSAPPTADTGRTVGGGHPDVDPFANLGGGGPAQPRPASTQSAPATKNGFGGPGKDQFTAAPAAKEPASAAKEPAPAMAPPTQWGGPSGPATGGLGPGGPAGGGPAGLGSTRSTPGIGQIPVSNGTNLFDNQYPASGRTSVQSSASLYEPGYRYEIKKDYLVTNPRELIHEYATTTPVTTIDPNVGETTRTITRQHYTQTVEESFGPFPPYGASNAVTPLKFVRQLRDETMTDSQRQANQQQTPLSANARDAQFEKRIDEIRRSTSRAQNDPVIEQLANQMRQSGAFSSAGGKP